MKGCSRGFTLVEVLVALVIVAVGMAAVLGTLGSSANTTAYLRDKTLAEWIGLNRIAELRLQAQQPSTGKSEADVDYAGRKWHWQQEVTATGVPGMVRIDVRVRPADVKGDDNGWFSTVSGISGDAVAAPRGDTPMYGNGLTPGGQPLPGGVPSGFGPTQTLGSSAPGSQTLGAPSAAPTPDRTPVPESSDSSEPTPSNPQ